LHDWRQFSVQTADLSQKKDLLQQDVQRLQTESQQFAAVAQNCDVQWEAVSAELAKLQEQIATIREAIANGDSRLAHNQLRSEELGQRNASVRDFLTKISSQLSDIQRRIADGLTELLAAEREFSETQTQLQALEQEQKSLEGTAQELRTRNDQARAIAAKLSALIHEFGKQISGLTSQASLGNESQRQVEGTCQTASFANARPATRILLGGTGSLTESAEAIDSNLPRHGVRLIKRGHNRAAKGSGGYNRNSGPSKGGSHCEVDSDSRESTKVLTRLG
jgi:chromosome segregation ATPase